MREYMPNMVKLALASMKTLETRSQSAKKVLNARRLAKLVSQAHATLASIREKKYLEKKATCVKDPMRQTRVFLSLSVVKALNAKSST